MKNQEIMARLEKLALKKSKPFCYSCYCSAPSGRCTKCQSDDLMLEMVGEGVEFGTAWILPILLRDKLTPVDLSEAFEQSIRDCYPETTQIGWIEYDTITALKQLDPLAFEMACSEWVDLEESDERIVSFDNGSTYYDVAELEAFLDESDAEAT